MATKSRRNRDAVERAATRTGACVSLIFDDTSLQLRQFGDLKACRRWIVWLRRGRQWLLALLTMARDKGFGMGDALGR